MRTRSCRAWWIAFTLLLLVVLPACSQGPSVPSWVREVRIRTHWGGYGPRADASIVITHGPDGYARDGHRVDSALIDALLVALRAPLIPEPNARDLGVTTSWLAEHAALQEPESTEFPGQPTAGQLALFRRSFSDRTLIDRLLPGLFNSMHTDDYPSARVDVTMEDGREFGAFSNSQFAWMLPWCVGPNKKSSYNPGISRAVAALMPAETVNKERLANADLASELKDSVMREIETAYALQGVEDRVGPDLTRLRHEYRVVTATIHAYIHEEYGPDKYDAEHEEVNLHADLHKASLPPNLMDEVTLLDRNGQIEGIDAFLAGATYYENLVMSVPWLKQFIVEHPKTTVRLTWVHEASLGNDAVRRFAADMKFREHNDVAARARAEQRQIALLLVGQQYAESYWLVFPDKHMVLWRYEGPSGLLNFKPTDFGEGECGGLGINDGGCSGREVGADGRLLATGTPRDVACVRAWRAQHPLPAAVPDGLFSVSQHDRTGYIDRKGAVVIPLCFEEAGEFSEGLAPFGRDGRWGYIDRAGNVVIEPTFPWAEEFYEGLAHVQATGSQLGMDGRWGYIDRSGDLVIPATYHEMSGNGGGESAFHEGLAMVEDDEHIPERHGYIDHRGKLVIPTRFTYAYPFSEGLAAVTESEDGDSGWGFIDKDGNWIIRPQFNWASSFRLGLAPVNRKPVCGYVDKLGEQVLKLESPPPPEDCASAWGDFTDGLSRWRFGSKYGYIDRSGKTVIAPQFDLTFGFSEGLAAVEVGKKWGFVNTAGKVVIPLQEFSDVKPFHNGLARVVVQKRGAGHIGYIDRTGRFVWGPYKQSDKEE